MIDTGYAINSPSGYRMARTDMKDTLRIGTGRESGRIGAENGLAADRTVIAPGSHRGRVRAGGGRTGIAPGAVPESRRGPYQNRIGPAVDRARPTAGDGGGSPVRPGTAPTAPQSLRPARRTP